jgi:alpha-D-ribose 1-methylphosphonate 5-triphosphate synthase subunit PhnH
MFEVLLGLVSSDVLLHWVGELFQAEVTKMAIAFMVAAELHSRKVKKEFALLRESIDHVASAMGKRLDGLDERMGRIELSKEK